MPQDSYEQDGPVDGESSQIQKDESSQGEKLSYVKPGSDTPERDVTQDDGSRFESDGQPTPPEASQIQK